MEFPDSNPALDFPATLGSAPKRTSRVRRAATRIDSSELEIKQLPSWTRSGGQRKVCDFLYASWTDSERAPNLAHGVLLVRQSTL